MPSGPYQRGAVSSAQNDGKGKHSPFVGRICREGLNRHACPEENADDREQADADDR